MLTRLASAPPDPLWAITAAFEADSRPDKVDLGLGIYRDDSGRTPVLASVLAVERQLATFAPSKAYRPLAGNAAFNAGMTRLLLGGDAFRDDRTVTLQTIGGTGALRMLAELIATAHPDARVWLSDPGYLNHRPLMDAAGLKLATYPWRSARGVANVDPMLDALRAARAGDVVLVQGCCHNPTGLDLPPEGWAALAALCGERGLVPLVDLAYHGLGDGLDADAAGLRCLVDRLDTVLIAASCSKNMSLYCERVGAALAVVPTSAAATSTRSVMENIGRRTYSMPPDHGAAVAAAILAVPAQWHAELDAMRQRIRAVRAALVDALRLARAPGALLDMAHHRGMFSVLPFTPPQMTALRDRYGLYGAPGGRINIAGIPACRVGQVADAIAAIALQTEAIMQVA